METDASQLPASARSGGPLLHGISAIFWLQPARPAWTWSERRTAGDAWASRCAHELGQATGGSVDAVEGVLVLAGEADQRPVRSGAFGHGRVAVSIGVQYTKDWVFPEERGPACAFLGFRYCGLFVGIRGPRCRVQAGGASSNQACTRTSSEPTPSAHWRAPTPAARR